MGWPPDEKSSGATNKTSNQGLWRSGLTPTAAYQLCLMFWSIWPLSRVTMRARERARERMRDRGGEKYKDRKVKRMGEVSTCWDEMEEQRLQERKREKG